MREKLGCVARLLRKALLQPPRDQQVKFVPSPAQERLVGHFLDQRVL
jgi:hypothetical protein